MLIPLLISYAEIHYRFRYLRPLYYRKIPEILADLPWRLDPARGSVLPVLILIKDAHLFPVKLKSIEAVISSREGISKQNFPVELELNSRYFSRILEVGLQNLEPDQNLNIDIFITIEQKGRLKTFRNDSYPLGKHSFRCYFGKEGLPYPPGWYAGEPHYHSNLTEDQVEFGADLAATRTMARALGLSWLFVTDHSYDLDDAIGDFTSNDANLPKWQSLWAQAAELQSQDFSIIPGEEVSIGNGRNRNVHLLVINNPEFIPGAGDSAEKWFRNSPELKIDDLPSRISDQALLVAAHPAEKVPLLQRLTLRRGYWKKEDLLNSNIKFLQLINSNDPAAVTESLNYWKKLLLAGHKFLIVAGNDAHGNFNISRQIRRPFLQLYNSEKQIFGRFHTVFKYKSNLPVEGFKHGCLICSNGPFLEFWLEQNGNRIDMGRIAGPTTAVFCYRAASSGEFGSITSIVLFRGIIAAGKEEKLQMPASGQEIKLSGSDYLRMELYTERGGRAISNPIWIADSHN
ncbi:MAG: CehA/McbA family metallohydrolase [Candidatus Cloacimonetes bacterium]|nr:CehA/McbA family metallohydrolase [Candidatus Cloacimonadota bacterium]